MRPLPSKLHLAAIAALLASPACKDDSSFDPEGDDTDDAPECVDDDGCFAYEICEGEACEPGDRNNSPDEAVSLLWEQPATGYLQSEGDQDYFTFQAEGGEFVRISTQPTPEEHENMNTVVSLYSPTGQLHHREDDHAVGPVTVYDTVLYAYLPDAGTWTVVVEDTEGVGNTAHAYELVVQETGAHTRESDSLESPSYTLDLTDEGATRIWAIGAALEEQGDVDWVQVDLPWDQCPVYLRGSQSTSGTDAIATVELYLPDGTHLMRKEDLGPGGSGAYFEVNGGQVFLAISDALGGGGDDFWTFVYLTIGEQGYPYAMEEEDNGLPTLANRAETEWETNEWGNYGAALAWGVMDEPGDEDWFLVEVRQDYYLTIRGTADGVGSMMDPVVEVYDVNETRIEVGDGGDDSFDDIYNLGPLDAGVYYLRISAEDADAAGPDQFYRVAISQSDYELADG